MPGEAQASQAGNLAPRPIPYIEFFTLTAFPPPKSNFQRLSVPKPMCHPSTPARNRKDGHPAWAATSPVVLTHIKPQLNPQHVMQIPSGIHGRLVVADGRVIQLHAQDAVIAMLLRDLVDALEVDRAVAQGAETAHLPISIFLIIRIHIFQMYISDAICVLLKRPHAVHASQGGVRRIGQRPTNSGSVLARKRSISSSR